MALALEQVEREGSIMRVEPGSVMELRFRTQQETIGEAIGRDHDRARGKAIHGVRLIEGPHHQGGEGELHAERSVALEDEAVERVEGVEVLIVPPGGAELRELPTLGRGRIDIGEMLEVGRIPEIAEAGHAVPLDFCLTLRLPQSGPHHQHGGRAGSQRERVAARNLAGRPPHDRALDLAALSASHHQIVGCAARPYFGISSGRPKRSQRAERVLG